MQKTPKPFRLSEQAIQIIENGARQLNTTQTAIVELALLEFDYNRYGTTDASTESEARNSLSPEAKAARQARKQEKFARKADLIEKVSGALPPKSNPEHTEDTGKESTSAIQTYCPRHRPKYCEPTCPHRVLA